MEKEVVSKLVYSIVQFLRCQLQYSDPMSSLLTEEGAESVEVALQCLETAYGVSSDTSHLSVSKSLYDIFSAEVGKEVPLSKPTLNLSPPTIEEKEEAETLKNEGNSLMRYESFELALEHYTKAIMKDKTNAVYYCNRAAAHSKLNNHQEAINDCERALNIEPNYSKAYGRMGLAYSALENAQKAKHCYEKALEIEPDNESYRGNLVIAEEKMQSQSNDQPSTSGSQGGAFNLFSSLAGGGGAGLLGNLAGLSGSGGAPDVQGLFNNPALMNMATTLMQDPNIQNMMSSFLGGGAPGSNAPPTAPPPPAAPNTESEPSPTTSSPGSTPGTGTNMEALLTAGRQLAEQMQAQHPDLVEQLRTQMNPGNQPPNGGGGSNPQDPPAS